MVTSNRSVCVHDTQSLWKVLEDYSELLSGTLENEKEDEI